MGAAVPRVVTSTSASGAQVIDGSLRFDRASSNALSFQPSSNGSNKKISTIAGWFTRGGNSSTSAQSLFSVGQDTNADYFEITISDDRFKVYNRSDGQNSGTAVNIWTSSYLRDFSGWYHFVVVLDSTQSTTSDRIKIYINGIRHLSFTNDDYPNQNYKFFSSTDPTVEERGIGRIVWSGGSLGQYFDGSMSQVYFIDGQALGPENFGYTDQLTNTWRPKKYTGNYNVSEKINLSLTQNNEAIDVVVNRVVDKCWIKSDGTWLGGGNPSDVSSAPTFNLLTGEAAASLYWATTAYDGAHTITIGTSSETGTQPEWDDKSGSWTIDSTTVISGTFSSSYGHARTGAMTDGNVYAFTFTINAPGAACNHSGWFITDEASIASYGSTVPDEQTSLNSVGARWYVASYTLGYWIHVGVYNNFLDINEYSDDGSYTMLGGGGANSFYLPFDGNFPIGNDKSKPIPINRGETWSSSLVSNDGFGRAGYEAYKGFNGVLTTTDYASTTNYGASKTLTFGPSPAITYHSTVEIMTRNSNVATVTFNGTTFLATDLQWQLIANGSGTISDSNTIVIDSASSSEYATLSGIRVDGVVLIDGTYGNGWSPVNFGGSTLIDKATGALPILNTINGGKEAGVGVRTDPYSANLVLALPLVGGANDESNQINSGSTTKVATVNGATVDTLISEFYGASFNFDGTNDYIDIPYSADFTFDGDFTIEYWIYLDGGSVWFDFGANGNYHNSYQFYAAAGNMFFYMNSATGINVGGTGYMDVPTGVWTHHAICREGTNCRVFANGILKKTTTLSGTAGNNTDNVLRLGAQNYSGPQAYFDGKLSDLRIYKGVAKYTENFIPASTNPDILPETPSGVAYGSGLTKVTDGSVYFDGTGDYLTAASSSDLTFGTGDFTVELFVNADNFTNRGTFYDSRPSGGTTGITIGHEASTGELRVYMNAASGADIIVQSTDFAIGRWYHVAVTRASGVVRLFVNGFLKDSDTPTSRDLNNTNTVNIGYKTYTSSGYNYFSGEISNLRVLKGTALYTANFTPPTAPLTNITNTKLLWCQSPTSVTDVAVGGSVNPWLPSGFTYWTAGMGSNWSQSGTKTSASGDYINVALPTSGKYYWETTLNSPSEFRQIGLQQGADFLPAYNNDYFGFYFNGNVGDPTAVFLTRNESGTDRGDSITNGSSAGSAFSNGEKVMWAWDADNDKVWLGRDGTWYASGDPASGANASISGEDLSANSWYLKIGYNNETGATNTLTLTNVASGDSGSTTYPVVNGDTKAYNSNPFNTDINTVMGPPTGYATLNPLMTYGSLTDGNLTHPGSTEGNSTSSIKVSSGKWYAEVILDTAGHLAFGWTYADAKATGWIGAQAPYYIAYNSGTTLQLLPGGSSTLTSGTGTIERLIPWQMCLDLDNNKAYLGDGKTWYNDDWNQTGSPGNPLTGENPTFTLPSGKEWYFFIYANLNGASKIWTNFGQKPLKYAPPEGYKLLNYTNLPSPGVVRSDKVVTATKWTSTGGSSTYDVDCGLAPDLIWHKCYDGTQNNSVFTSTLGPHVRLDTSGNSNGQDWYPAYFTGFTHNGYSVSSTSSDLNPAAGAKMISYCWKAGGSGQPILDLVFGANTDDNGFDTTSTSRTYDTTGFSFASYTTPQDHPGGTYGANSAQVYKSSSGKVVKWTVSTSTANKYIWTSSDGINWVSKGSQYDTDTAPGVVISKWIALSGGSNAATLTVKGYSAFNIDDVGYSDAAAAGLTGAVNCTQEAASVGTKQGFSITVQESGTSGATMQIPHGLTQKPDFIIGKDFDTNTTDWAVYHVVMGAANKMDINASTVSSANANYWANTEPTDSVVYTKSASWMYPSSSFVMYCWHNVPGLQKFGMYDANGSDANGPFVYLGFRPAIIMLMCYSGSGENRYIYSDKAGEWQSSTANPNYSPSFLNDNAAANTSTTGYRVDFLSNGFRLRQSNGPNTSSPASKYIYAAWAHQPMDNLYGSQSNAY